ncbi:MAG: oligosaccharide flippase family protein [Gemmatimonadaceae bacterium]
MWAPCLQAGAIPSTLVAVAGAGASFVAQVILAHALGQAAFGAYALALAMMNAVLLFGKLEIDNVGVRYSSAYSAQHRWALLRGYMRASRRATM